MHKYFLFAVGLLILVDIAVDALEGESLLHLMLEAAILALVGLVSWYLWVDARKQRKQVLDLGKQLQEIRKDTVYWKSEAQNLLAGLGHLIDEQFSEWHLSEAEREVGLLLLKGFSHKEIAAIRNTSDRTIRHQATSIYHKASLENRAQLSAFFLEDLLLPKDVR